MTFNRPNKTYITTCYFILFSLLISCKLAKTTPTQESKITLENKIKKYLSSEYLSEGDLRVISTEERKFQYETADLNGDKIDEVFIYLNSRYFCGSGGCSYLLMDSDLNLITKFTVTRSIYISDETQNGWKKLYLSSNGYREMIYNTQNKSYPSNPSVEKEIKSINESDVIQLFTSSNDIQF